MKKLISFVCIVALVFGMLNTASFAQSNKKITVDFIYDESFDFTPEGSMPTSGTAVPKTNKLSAATVNGRSGRSLKYELLTDSDIYYEFVATEAKNNIVFEFDYYMEKLGGQTPRLYFKDNADKDVRIVSIGKDGCLYRADGTFIAKLNQDSFSHICINYKFSNNKADVYVNKKKKASDISLSPANFDGVKRVRFYVSSSTDPEKSVFYLDNIRAYDLPYPIFNYELTGYEVETNKTVASQYDIARDYEAEDYMQNTIALCTGSNKIAVDGEVGYLDESNHDVRVYVKDSRAFVPVRFISETLGFDVNYNDLKREVTISDKNNKIILTVDKKECFVNGNEQPLDVAPEITGDRLFVPVRAVCEIFGKKLTYDKNGLIVIADKEDFFNMSGDLSVYRYICGELVFDEPSGEEMISMLKENYPGGEHPRLYFNKTKLNELKEQIASNELMAGWYDDVVKSADKYLDMPLVEYEIYDGIRLYDRCHQIKLRVTDLGFVYLMTGDEKYAKRAYEEIEHAATYPDWNPSHFLDTSEMLLAYATCYDWLYDYLSDDQKKLMREAVVEKGLQPAMNDYETPLDTPRQYGGYDWVKASHTSPDNWVLICNSAVIVASLAFGDEIDMASKLLDYGMDGIKSSILMYAPDGAWFEGPSYWGFATTNYIDFAESILNVYGEDFGYIRAPGISQTVYYPYAAGQFAIHDASPSDTVNTEKYSADYFYFAKLFGDEGLTAHMAKACQRVNGSGSVRMILFYDYNAAQDGEFVLNKDVYFRGSEIAIMTDGWDYDNNIYVGFHSGDVDVKHGQADAGQVNIDAYGTRFAVEVGREDSKFEGSTKVYRNRAEGHNVIVINPDDSYGQAKTGTARIERAESNETSSFVISDISSPYQLYAKNMKRGVKLTNNRSLVIIQDEMNLNQESEIYWFMHTKCPITILNDGKAAKFDGKYRDMYVYLLEDVDGTFSVMDASPMPTSPVVEGQKSNAGYRKLCFNAKNVKDLTLAIACSFEVPGIENPEFYRPEVVPLDQWQLDDSSVPQKPYLDDLKLNGNTIEGFYPDNLGYVVRLDHDAPDPIVEATAQDGAEVEVKMPGELPGNAVITVRSSSDRNIKTNYVLKLDKKILSKGPDGTIEIPVKSVGASDVPQAANIPENTIDGDLKTRWSAENRAQITYDFGAVRKVTHVGLAIMEGNARRQFFEVHVSNDGETFEKVYEGETSGTTADLEVFQVIARDARYVMIDCKNTSVGNWNSITECKIYGIAK
ncbi:MAG: discoidin domain-containing protein [Clostridia bacterium]|nr:discoidin domain-containing protein [Clostridia bacterium]